MNSRSTQRFIGLFVAAVVSILVLIALPAVERDPAPRGGARRERAHAARVRAPGRLVGAAALRRAHAAPPGWQPSERYSRPFAQRDPAAPLAGNLNVLSLPNLFNLDLQGLAEENRKSLEAAEVLELIALEELLLGDGHPALGSTTAGRPGARSCTSRRSSSSTAGTRS